MARVAVPSNPYSSRVTVADQSSMTDRPMRVLMHLHKYPPEHNAGAEWMAHTLSRYLIEQGCEVRAAVRDIKEPYTYEGVEVMPGIPDKMLAEPYGWCDIAITHLDVTRSAVAWSRTARRPLVHLVHNHKQLDFHHVHVNQAQLVVFNSEWTAKLFGKWKGPKIVVRPPVDVDRYRIKHRRGDAITLINLNRQKGGDVFWELVERFPKKLFLGVKGAYGDQIVPKILPTNVRIVENTPDIKAVYEQTRILLMPSSYESWGRTGVEAIASGIPVIANGTEGLRESLKGCGLFAELDDSFQWESWIELLDNPRFYAEVERRSLRRSKEISAMTVKDLKLFHHSLTTAAHVRR